MQITNINLVKVEENGYGRLKAMASILIDNEFVVKDIKVIKGDNGLFIAMPSRKTATGGYRDIAHPINQEVRTLFEQEILKAYNEAE